MEARNENDTEFAVVKPLADRLRIDSAEHLRPWARQAEVDIGTRPGVASAESERTPSPRSATLIPTWNIHLLGFARCVKRG